MPHARSFEGSRLWSTGVAFGSDSVEQQLQELLLNHLDMLSSCGSPLF
jgi:hypothetical protein